MKKLIIFVLFLYCSIVNAQDVCYARGEQLIQIDYHLTQILIEIKRQNLILCAEKTKTGDKQMIKICEYILINKGEV